MNAPTPPPIDYTQIRDLHAAFNRLTGSELSYTFAREADWKLWLQQRPDRPFTVADLIAVVAHLKKEIFACARPVACLKFHNLIGRPDIFEQDLSDATIKLRRPPPAQKTVQTATPQGSTSRRVQDPLPGKVVPVSQVIAEMKRVVEEG